MAKSTIYVVDDDLGVQGFLFTFLSIRGYEVTCFGSGAALLQKLSPHQVPGLILLDVLMPDADGIAVLEKIRALGLNVPILMLSGLSDLRTVVEAMKLGAVNFLMKPFEEEALDQVLAEVFSEENLAAAARPADTEASYAREFLTANPKVLQQAGIVARVSRTDVPVLILGESGVGKEVMARFAHRHSGRKDKPFIKINCAALPHELVESELFGHDKGAFTGALEERKGKFEQADGGTLLLDEIGEMTAALQSKLLHVLQDGTFSRLGGRKNLKVDVRVIAATNIKLEEAIAKGTFREDLYYRLNVIRVDLPPLRDRLEDIPLLCEFFVGEYREKYRSPIDAIPDRLLYAFSQYSWPGNIRQLENAVKRFLLLQNVDDAEQELVPERESPFFAPPKAAAPPASLLMVGAKAAERAERELVHRVLEETGGNRKQAARNLNICYKALLNKLKRWNSEARSNAA